jgi:hypothetical protein
MPEPQEQRDVSADSSTREQKQAETAPTPEEVDLVDLFADDDLASYETRG